MMAHVPLPTRRALARLVTATTLISSVSVLALAAGPGSTVFAATTCVNSAPFAHQLLTPAAYNANAKFGAASVTADFNGDHFADLVVGAPGDLSGSGTVAGGNVSLYLGSATGLGTPRRISESNVTGMAPEAGDKFGQALAAGDFNNDGKADLAVGAPGESIGTVANAGAVAIFLGTATGLATTGTGLDQNGLGGKAETSDQFGAAIAAGNFIGTANAELAVGAPGEAPGTKTVVAGEVNVAKWGTSGLVTGWTLNQGNTSVGADEAGDKYGAALAAGNVTGDSKADLLVGTPGEDIEAAPAKADTGSLNVYPGGTSAFGAGFTANQSGVEAGDLYGSSVAVGDFDKTGGADIAVGIPGEVATFGTGSEQTNTKVGAVQVTKGPIASGSNGGYYRVDEHLTGQDIHNGDRWGTALAVGDVNGDTYPDLFVGAPGFSKGGPANGGVGYVGLGAATAPLQRGRLVAQNDVGAGNETSDEFGSSVALGDFNGDGRAEGAIGAQGEVIGSNPRSGSVNALFNLQPPATTRPIEQYAPTTALQSAPAQPGAAVGLVRFAYVDNIGGSKIATLQSPENTGSPTWDAGTPLEAVLTGRPAIGQGSDGKGVVAARSTTGDVWVRTETTAGQTAWGPWVNYRGPDVSGLTAITLDNGRVGFFGIGATGELVVLPQTSTGVFGAWQGTGIMNLTGDPVVVTVAGGTRVFARDTDGNVHTALFANLAMTGCTTVGDAQIIGTPAVVTLPGSRLRLFATTADHQLLTIGQDVSGAFETTWSQVQPTDVAGPPVAALDSTSGKITVFARGSDQAIWSATETLQGSATWGTWHTANEGQPAATDVTLMTYTGGTRGPGYLFTYRDANNVQRVWYAENASTAALAKQGAERSYIGKSLPKASPPKAKG
jgi:hypothetical protein